jgi:uncharacterized protein YodC (DUF2158 family)
MTETLKPSDVVQLKSGGPMMTVQDVGDYGVQGTGALCVWFDQQQQQTNAVFAPAMLDKVDEHGA